MLEQKGGNTGMYKLSGAGGVWRLAARETEDFMVPRRSADCHGGATPRGNVVRFLASWQWLAVAHAYHQQTIVR
jgi:hypothetical protein